MIPQEVRDLAAGIVDEIAQFGHYQGDGPHYMAEPCGDDGGPDAPRCVIYASWTDWAVYQRLVDYLPGAEDDAVDEWNDNTPTPEVLATLRKIAAGERP